MTRNGTRFATLLRSAIRMIRAREDKPLGLIRDELGHLIDHAGSDYILYLEKGHIPPDEGEVRKLVDELLRRGGLSPQERDQMLRAAALPPPAAGSPGAPPADDPGGNLDAEHAGAGDAASEPHEGPGKVFVAGPAIRDATRFFGRTRELTRIFGYWKHPPLEHIAIVGPRRAGKTSLLHYLATITTTLPTQRRPGQKHDWLPRPERVRWLLLDLQSAGMAEPQQIMHVLVERFGLAPSTPLTLPAVMEAIGTSGDTRPAILLLDELGAGFARLGRDFWWGLRAEIVNGRNPHLALVTASHVNPIKLRTTPDTTSPFSNIFADSIALGPFTEPEAHELIAAAPPETFTEEEIDWIMRRSGRWPQLLQILCQERLRAREERDGSERWREEGLRRIEPFAYLLDAKAAR